MPDMTDLGVVAGNYAYDAALHDLAHSLVRVWIICETAGIGPDSEISFGGNLPEALSCALGMTAVALGLDRDEAGALIDDAYARGAAGDGLVRHRPGSWEATHVRALTFTPELISHEAA
jgi:hypothetical protein